MGRGGYVECGEEREVRLVDGRKVPRAVGKYKHLGTEMAVSGTRRAVEEKVVARCRGVAGMLARLGCLTAAQYVEAVDMATRSIVMYYGAATPMCAEACERVDVAKRVGLVMLGHRRRRSARWLVHEAAREGGLAMG